MRDGIHGGLYDRPDWFELVHWGGTAGEVRLLEIIHRLHGNGGKSWLEPACGSGRYLKIASRRGWKTAGYDANEKMLAYARKRLPDGDLALDDLRTFRRRSAFDFAFCLQSTFRHLLTEADASAHLRGTAASLRPGGLYVVGLDLLDYASAHDDEEVFEAVRGKRRARLTMFVLPPDRRRRRERIISFTTLEESGQARTIQDEYELRSYDKAQFERLIKASPFRLEAVYDLLGAPRALSGLTRDALFVLKKG